MWDWLERPFLQGVIFACKYSGPWPMEDCHPHPVVRTAADDEKGWAVQGHA